MYIENVLKHNLMLVNYVMNFQWICAVKYMPYLRIKANNNGPADWLNDWLCSRMLDCSDANSPANVHTLLRTYIHIHTHIYTHTHTWTHEHTLLCTYMWNLTKLYLRISLWKSLQEALQEIGVLHFRWPLVCCGQRWLRSTTNAEKLDLFEKELMTDRQNGYM